MVGTAFNSFNKMRQYPEKGNNNRKKAKRGNE